MNRRYFQLSLPATILALAALTACDRSHAPQQNDTTLAETRTATDGPVTLTLSASAKEVDAGKPIDVHIQIDAESGVIVAPKNYESTLRDGDRAFDTRITLLEKLENQPIEKNRRRWSYRYAVEFVLPDTYELPPASLTFVASAPAAEPPIDNAESTISTSKSLETAPISVTVRQLPGSTLTEEQLKSIKTLDPVELPAKWSRWWWLAPLLIIAAAALLAFLLYLLGRLIPALRRWWPKKMHSWQPPPPPPIPAHEWARRELAALIALDLIRSDQLKTFYYRITDIVRGYVERRFEVAAPEMTTEEFLAAAAADRRFGPEVTAELNRFLAACDLVKYAAQRPDPQEADALVHATLAFVERTRQRAAANGAANGASDWLASGPAPPAAPRYAETPS